MADRSIRIRIGCSVDRDLANVFPSLDAAAKKAAASIQATLNAAMSAAGASAKTRMVTPTVAGLREVEKEAAKTGPAVSSTLIRAVTEIMKESKTNFGLIKRDMATLASDAEREMGRMERATRKAAAEQTNFGAALRKTLDAQTRISAGGLMGAAGAIGRPAMRAARMAFGVARGLAGDIARGAGVGFDIGSMVQQGVGLESAATTMSNQAFMPGASGAAGRRVDPGEIVKQVRAVSNETALDPTKAMAGLEAFVAKTGDLETGRNVLKDMAVLSRATGANLEDVVDASGDVANQLGNVENKGAVVANIMRGIAGQGKLGAVEMKDFASQMAKVAAASSQFGGDKVRNMLVLGAIAQSSRQSGGSASATQAATAVTAFTAQFSKGARLDAMKSFGVDFQDKNGQLLDPQQIITKALQASGSSKNGGMESFRTNLASMIKDQQAQRAIKGFAGIYQQTFATTQGDEAAKTAAATRAVTEEFERLTKAAMSVQETNDSFKASMNTTEAKVQRFNNRMSETADALRAGLLPAAEAVAPALIAAATAAAGFVDKLFGNKGAEASATNAEINQAMRGARLRRQLHGEMPLSREDVSAADRDQGVIQQDIARRQAAVAQRQAFSVQSKSSLFKYSVGSTLAAAAFDTLSGQKEDRGVAIQEDQRRIKSSQGDIDTMNDTLKQIHRKFDGVLRVEVVGGNGAPPAAPTNPAVRTGP